MNRLLRKLQVLSFIASAVAFTQQHFFSHKVEKKESILLAISRMFDTNKLGRLEDYLSIDPLLGVIGTFH